MAQRAVSEKSITCVICLDLLTEPVTLPCGHSYCMHCIKDHWDRQVNFSCPQCRQSFDSRPVLVKSTVLDNVVKELKEAGLTAPPIDSCYAGPGDVGCAVCSGRKMKAVSFCLQCLGSYCATHLQHHCYLATLKTHQLMGPSDRLQENLCSQQSDLPTRRALLLQSLQNKEAYMKKLQLEAQDITRSAQRAVQRSADIFREMALLLEIKRSEVEKQVRSEEITQLRRTQELQDQLHWSILDLKRGISELDTLLIPNHNQFIRHCPSLSTDTQRDLTRIHMKHQRYFEDVHTAVSALRDKLQFTLSQGQAQPEPSSREDLLKLARDIILDPNPANPHLYLFEGNRTEGQNQTYPDAV